MRARAWARGALAVADTARRVRFLANVRVWLDRWDAMWAHHGTRRAARQRFQAKIREQRTLAHVANTVLGPDRSRIAVFGDACWGCRHGVPPSPVKKLRQHLAKLGRVVLVDEYLSSQCCSSCGVRMTRSSKSIRVLHCKSGCTKTTWNRDKNAALNLAACFDAHMAGQQRPPPLRRPPAAATTTTTSDGHGPGPLTALPEQR